MLSQHAMHQPIIGLENNAISECNVANTPYITACRNSGRQAEGIDFSGSLV